MSTGDDVKALLATLAVVVLFVVMARLLGKLFWVSLTDQVERKKDLLRRLRPR